MKPEEQRIAIAEACGWKPDDDGDGTGWKGSWIHQRLIGMKPTFRGGKVVSYLIEQTVPDYLNDLNAMHEAEKVLSTEAQQFNFANILYDLTQGFKPDEVQDWLPDFWEVSRSNVFAHIHATATQRAEAFLRTLNLYTP